MKQLRVALAGNPNAGKSTIFNGLTGNRQHVGNWPGKTVARKEGYFDIEAVRVLLVDLPGTYSLSAYSPEEEIARDYIIWEKPDLVVNVVDASNLERNLYLTAQIMETAVPFIVVLNMSDMAERRGYTIDYTALSHHLGGAPVIPAVASQEKGLAEIRAAILAGNTNGTQNTQRLQGTCDDSGHSPLARLRRVSSCH